MYTLFLLGPSGSQGFPVKPANSPALQVSVHDVQYLFKIVANQNDEVGCDRMPVSKTMGISKLGLSLDAQPPGEDM